MLVSLDSETELVTEFNKAPRLVCVSFEEETGRRGLLRWCDAKPYVAQALSHHTIVGANIAYDMGVWANEWEDLRPLIWQAYAEDRVRDVQIEAKLTDIEHGESTKRSYALATLMKDAFGIVRDKTTYRLDYDKLREVPIDLWPEGARKYALDDAGDPLKLLREAGLSDSPDKFQQARHAWWTHLMGVWGIRTDPARVEKLKAELLRRRDDVIGALLSAGIIRPDGSQNKKLTQEFMIKAFAAMGKKPPLTDPSPSFPGGQVSTKAEWCRDSGDPLLEKMAIFASLRKQLSTDIPNLERYEIHTKYDSLKDSGRVGSGGEDSTSPTGTAFNLTNLPRKGGVRECFVPRPGKVFFDADYKALEAYTGAQACLWLVGESTLADLLRRDEDYHIHTSVAYLDIDYAEGLKRKAEGDREIKTLRQFSKIFNYSLQGGGGQNMIYNHAQTELKKDDLFELARQLTRAQSDKLWNVWRRRYPEWLSYFAHNGSMTNRGGCVFEQLVSGRKRGVFGDRAYTELNNGWFQGLGADAAKDAGWYISRECYDPSQNSVLFGSRIVLFGHDSITGETDPEGAHDVAMRVKERMEGVSDRWCPDVPLRTEPALASCFSKGAEAIYDRNGRLLVWSPDETDRAA